MLADDLVGPIALDALGAGIPVGDDAVLVEHENGVIRDAPDEKPEAVFALTKLRQGLGQLSGPFCDAALERLVETPPRLVDFFALAEIEQHVHCPNQPTRSIMKRSRIGHEGHTRSVGSLGYRLPIADRPIFLQSPRHWALVMGHWSAIRPI